MQYEPAILRKLQLLELEMLKEIDTVCKQLGIQYFLDSGTALGAARHQGFIPWDDDVDLGMMRDDYERFLVEAPTLLPGNYRLCTPINTEGYAPLFAKVMRIDTKFATQETMDAGFEQGVFVDIFPYDALSIDLKTAQQQERQCTLSQKLSYLYHSGNIVVPHRGALGMAEKAACKAAHHVVRRVASPQKLSANFDAWAKKGALDPSEYVMPFAYPINGGFHLGWLLPFQEMDFEGEAFPVPRDIDSYLSRMYGDWRALPSEDQRINHAPLGLDLADT